jgi:transcriptional regulator with XRE-family HTH domain
MVSFKIRGESKMEKEMNNVVFNFFLDLRKKEIDKKVRAELINKYLKDNKMSQRQLASELGIPHSTIQDWLLFTRIPKAKYQEYIRKGHTETDIYRALRDNKGADLDDIETSLEQKKSRININGLEKDIDETITKFRALIHRHDYLDPNCVERIKELINILNRIIINKERGLR